MRCLSTVNNLRLDLVSSIFFFLFFFFPQSISLWHFLVFVYHNGTSTPRAIAHAIRNEMSVHAVALMDAAALLACMQRRVGVGIIKQGP
jgi:hypothetical protein